ncbi:GNAT family N-acetyltransferase [Mesorhizobium sp. BAC0120]|uniref:GNAT family N-acetyltransferase n=1 Tax=Mesorhizobium sp. BAC0120 TaxID=3090670 RepID=UPI00298BD7D4|nr:GNAT family N-acetyltransferase [Mesorhizobium sp. BAC0120]MDW6023148.1 GNAT family N-acetyltransferase [Mesorhizobium sp. BAC0120]
MASDAVSLIDTASEAGAAAATARFSVKITTRAEVAGCPAWAATFADQRKDHRYYEIVEDTLRDRVEYRYFAIFDEAGCIQAVQPFFLLDQDILEGLGTEWQTWLARIRRFVPRFLKMRTLMVGCFAGEGHLAASDMVPSGEMAGILRREIVNLSRSCRAQLIVLKEFPARYRPVLDCFLRRGFARAPSMPMTALNIEYEDFDAYLKNALPRSARWQLRKKFKATEGETLALTVTDDAKDSIDEIYPLYLQVFERAKLRFEKLTDDYFRRLGSDMGDKTLFFIWRRSGKVVAFSLCMVEGDSLFWEYVGLDYAVALDLHLYYYTIRDMVNWAIANGYRRLRSTGLSYEPKFRMRHELDPLDLYARLRSPLPNTIFRLLLPWIVPACYDKTLRKFANYRDLW